VTGRPADFSVTAPGRSWSVARVVFGNEGRIASSVYGTVLVMATLAAASGEKGHPWRLAGLVLGAVVTVWIAHLYAHALSHSIERGRRVTRSDFAEIAHRELGIVLAAVYPTAALVAGALGLVSEETAVWAAIGIGLAVLGTQGVRYARVERLSSTATVAAVAANLALGLVVVGLKAFVIH
jgi:hypothetical protein